MELDVGEPEREDVCVDEPDDSGGGKDVWMVKSGSDDDESCASAEDEQEYPRER